MKRLASVVLVVFLLSFLVTSYCLWADTTPGFTGKGKAAIIGQYTYAQSTGKTLTQMCNRTTPFLFHGDVASASTNGTGDYLYATVAGLGNLTIDPGSVHTFNAVDSDSVKFFGIAGDKFNIIGEEVVGVPLN